MIHTYAGLATGTTLALAALYLLTRVTLQRTRCELFHMEQRLHAETEWATLLLHDRDPLTNRTHPPYDWENE